MARDEKSEVQNANSDMIAQQILAKIEAYNSKNSEKATSATSTEFESFPGSASTQGSSDRPLTLSRSSSINKVSTGTCTYADPQKILKEVAALAKKSTGTSPPPQEISTQVTVYNSFV